MYIVPKLAPPRPGPIVRKERIGLDPTRTPKRAQNLNLILYVSVWRSYLHPLKRTSSAARRKISHQSSATYLSPTRAAPISVNVVSKKQSQTGFYDIYMDLSPSTFNSLTVFDVRLEWLMGRPS